MNEKIRSYLIALVCGLIMGAGIVGAIWYTSTAADRAELKRLQSVVADRDRLVGQLDRELGEARALAEQHRELDKQITLSLTESLGYINQARTEYERSLAYLKFARNIIEVLRKRYDPAYHGAAPAVP